jgi:NAD(P)-dependent dehydrogenase (short-subunit alcohol dehydrogenase family)
MGQLEGKVILVTGASRGIGLAISRTLGAERARLVLVAKGSATLKRAAARLPGAVLALPADLTDPAEVKRLFAAVRLRFRRLDVLVNCAGVFAYKPFAKTTWKDWRSNVDSNLTSVFLTTKAALPLLARSRGHVVNILSISSIQAFPNCSAYCASKFGALGLTRVLREELRPRNIRVTGIIPGSTDTRMKKEFDFPVREENLLQPEDVAACVLGALLQPARAMVEEIVVMPSGGKLGPKL